MQTPQKIVADLNALSERYDRLQSHFSKFAEDVKAFFSQNGAVNGLTFEAQEADKKKRASFIVAYVGMRIQFRFSMSNNRGLVTMMNITDPANVKELMTWRFNGEGAMELWAENGDQLDLVGGDGRHVFVHMLEEAVKGLHQ